ncbi:MAG: hypothetical protein UC703_10040 [Bacilli bacterium]|nr:hypothetical protein [Bacilli bacterium]
MIWFTSDLHFFHDRILEFHPKRKEIFGSTVEKAKEAMIQFMIHGHCHGKVDQINTDSKELRVDVGIDGNLANYDLISLEKLANHFIKIEKYNEHGMVK